MSGVFSIASHWVLQYLPDVVMQEQIGCAHFSGFAVDIFFPPTFGPTVYDPVPYFRMLEILFLSDKEHISH